MKIVARVGQIRRCTKIIKISLENFLPIKKTPNRWDKKDIKKVITKLTYQTLIFYNKLTCRINKRRAPSTRTDKAV